VILVLVELEGGAPSPASLEALTAARGLGDELGAVVVADPDGAASLGAYGVPRAYVCADERLRDYAPEAWAACVRAAVEAGEASAVVAPGTDRGQEVLAHLGASLGVAVAANCVEVEAGETFRVTRQRWGGTLLEEAELRGAPRLLTVAPGIVAPAPASNGVETEVTSLAPELSEKAFRVRVTAVVEPEAGKVSLPQARVVVGGGRGVGSEEGFEPLAELAQLLGGALGCSRAITSLGWRPHTDQIGQTGTRISPELYIACGISGATQHVVGCRGAKHILAINKDAQAPILSRADWAVIGDLREIVPALNEEIRKAKAGSSG
jgi:electron transfer flavoprotein alpha subunit